MSHAATGSASGKVILCGEHSVVYGRPAIAVPVRDLRAYAEFLPVDVGGGLRLVAPDLSARVRLSDAATDHPLAAIVRLTLDALDVRAPDGALTIRSDLPIAAGLGSGAAVSAAIVRTLVAYFNRELSIAKLSALVYEVEKIHHGTPSGIDNTVVSWERPVFFIKGEPPERFTIGAPFGLLIANSGVASSTREMVAGVRARHEAAPHRYDALFDRMGALASRARHALETGALPLLGKLLNENHDLLQDVGVSHPALDRLVDAARAAGALGAKLTGAGGGGNVIALVPPERAATVQEAVRAAEATQLWYTTVGD
jgi:mevalonate kinase